MSKHLTVYILFSLLVYLISILPLRQWHIKIADFGVFGKAAAMLVKVRNCITLMY